MGTEKAVRTTGKQQHLCNGIPLQTVAEVLFYIAVGYGGSTVNFRKVNVEFFYFSKQGALMHAEFFCGSGSVESIAFQS